MNNKNSPFLADSWKTQVCAGQTQVARMLIGKTQARLAEISHKITHKIFYRKRRNWPFLADFWKTQVRAGHTQVGACHTHVTHITRRLTQATRRLDEKTQAHLAEISHEIALKIFYRKHENLPILAHFWKTQVRACHTQVERRLRMSIWSKFHRKKPGVPGKQSLRAWENNPPCPHSRVVVAYQSFL